MLALEPEAVYLAAQKAGEKEIRKLEQLMLICEETAADYILYINGHNEDIDKFVEKSLKIHREIFDAIKNKDAEKAKALARRHLLDDVEKGMKIGQTV